MTLVPNQSSAGSPPRSATLPLDFDRAPAPAEPTAPPPKPAQEGPRTLSVAELDRAIRRSLDVAFERPIWVEGEVTGVRPAASGHLYFVLRDEREEASIDVVAYKTSLTARTRALVVDGARVRLRGRPTFWPPRGRLQFVVDRVELAGRGALLEALEKRKAKLAAEGLFSVERKRPLPAEPRIVGVVTSRAGAAIHDICRVAFRRGGAHILLAPALVQGGGAAASVARAIAALSRVAEVDVIIVGRGGGSVDDLDAFNDERLVRAIAACRVPVVSAVGHEIDVSLTDFAADARAATPSQAAEMVVPDSRARRAVVTQTSARLVRTVRIRLAEERGALGTAQRRLGDPRLVLASFQQLLDDRRARLARLHPSARIVREQAAVGRAFDRMSAVMRRGLARRGHDRHALEGRLVAMSPLAVLARGYAIATRADGRAIRGADDISPGERIGVRVFSASLEADVVQVTPGPRVVEGEREKGGSS